MKITLSYFFIFFCTILFSQQGIFSQLFWINNQNSNPAYISLEDSSSIELLYNNPSFYSQIDGAPVSIMAAYQTRIKKVGLGFNFSHDEIGFNRLQQYKLGGNYRFNLKNKHTLILGFNGVISVNSLNPIWIPPTTNPDPTLPTIETNSYLLYDLGIAYDAKRWNLGLSMVQGVIAPLTEATSFNFDYAQFYQMQGRFQIVERSNYKIETRLSINTDLNKTVNTLLFNYAKENRFWFGAGAKFYFSQVPAPIISGGVSWKNFSINISLADDIFSQNFSGFRPWLEVGAKYSFRKK